MSHGLTKHSCIRSESPHIHTCLFLVTTRAHVHFLKVLWVYNFYSYFFHWCKQITSNSFEIDNRIAWPIKQRDLGDDGQSVTSGKLTSLKTTQFLYLLNEDS